MNEQAQALEWESWFAQWLKQQAARNVVEMLPHGIQVIATCASTQDECMKLGREGQCCVAIRQSRGRGRLGRKWHDGGGSAAMLTIAVPIESNREDWIECLSIQAGMACCCAAEHMVAKPNIPDLKRDIRGVGVGRAERSKFVFGIRWPNDVMAHGKKLAGILIEARADIVFLGIGMNVSANQWEGELAGKTVSLQEIDSRPLDKRHVIAEILTVLAEVFEWDHPRLEAAFADRDILRGNICTFTVGQRRIQGMVERIDPLRGLLVRELDPTTPDGVNGQTTYLPARLTSLRAIGDEPKQ